MFIGRHAAEYYALRLRSAHTHPARRCRGASQLSLCGALSCGVEPDELPVHERLAYACAIFRGHGVGLARFGRGRSSSGPIYGIRVLYVPERPVYVRLVYELSELLYGVYGMYTRIPPGEYRGGYVREPRPDGPERHTPSGRLSIRQRRPVYAGIRASLG